MLRVGVAIALVGCAESTPPVVTTRAAVLEVGAEPRKLLRYTFTAGAVEHVETDQKLTLATTVSPQVATPTMRLSEDIRIVSVSGDGTANVEATITGLQFLDDAPGGAMLAAGMGGVVGTRFHYKLSTRGDTSAVSISLPPGAPDALRGRIEQLGAATALATPPLPEDPVGVGGRWDSETTFAQQGLGIKATIHVRLTELGVSSAHLEEDLQIGADPHRTATGGNTSIRLDHAEGHGHVAVMWNAEAPLAIVDGDFTFAATMTFERNRHEGTASLRVQSHFATRRLP